MGPRLRAATRLSVAEGDGEGLAVSESWLAESRLSIAGYAGTPPLSTIGSMASTNVSTSSSVV
jgi:hypothetical protein